MARLAFIASTGNYTTDQVLVGVMGHLSPETGFTPIEEFKNIPAVHVLTPELFLSNPGSVVEMEIDDSVLPAVKALVASRLQKHWVAMYNETVARMPGRMVMRSIIFNERDKVVAACKACTGVFEHEAPWISAAKSFQNDMGKRASTDNDDYDDYDNDGYGDDRATAETDTVSLNAIDVLKESNASWTTYETSTPPPHVNDEPMESFPYPFHKASSVSTFSDQNASGVAVLQMRFHGDSAQLVNVLNALPKEMYGLMYNNIDSNGGNADAEKSVISDFAEVRWHMPRMVDELPIDQGNAGAGTAPVMPQVTQALEALEALVAPISPTSVASIPGGLQSFASGQLSQLGQTGMDFVTAAYERGRMVGRVEGYSNGYAAKAIEVEQDGEQAGEGEDPPADAPTAG